MVKISNGVFGNVTQFVVFKSAFCCKTNLAEGTAHEMARFVLNDISFNFGDGVVCKQ